MGRGAGEALEDGSDNAEPSLPLQEQCITFDRVLGSDAAQVGGVVGKREEDGNLRRLDPGVLRVSQAHGSGRLGQGTCD